LAARRRVDQPDLDGQPHDRGRADTQIIASGTPPTADNLMVIAAPNEHSGAVLTARTGGQIAEQNGGSARGYQGRFASLAAGQRR